MALSYRQECRLDYEMVLERGDPMQQRLAGVAASREFGELIEGTGGRSYTGLIPQALELEDQVELDLVAYSDRAVIRQALGKKIERQVFPIFRPRWLERYPDRLRQARKTGAFGIALASNKAVVFWDKKAGLSRLCPDDAREEAMRLRRRVQPMLVELQQSRRHRLTYAVFTMPNFAPGKLRDGMVAVERRFKALLPKFPQIKGALTVLEAPLGARRDWNVHLNVIFASEGFVDWGKLRAAWHWNVEFKQLSNAPGAIGTALAELIKYAVAATAEKSMEHAENGRSRAPAMLEWSGCELAEWLAAMHGFRGTRT